MNEIFPGRLAIQQRVLPLYRAPFFDLLAGLCAGGLSVFAGKPMPEENTASAPSLQKACLVPAENINFLRTTSPLYRCWQKGWQDWLESWQPDVLIVEGNPRTSSTPHLAAWMHARGRPILGWGLGAPPLSGPLRFWRERTRRSFLQHLDGMIAYSQRGAHDYHLLGFRTEQVFVAPNAVVPRPTWPLPYRSNQTYGSTLPYPSDQSHRSDLPYLSDQPHRSDLPYPSDRFNTRPIVLFVGRLQTRKRLDHLFSACAALPEGLQPRLIIVGDGPARPDFESEARQRYPSAEFTGALHGEPLACLFRQADLFVLPGSGGLAIQEAMSYGLPVIVGAGDGTQGDLVGPENGWLIPTDSLEDLSVALKEALSDVPRLRQMGAAAYRKVQQEANLEAMAAAFIQAALKYLPATKRR